MTTLRRTALTDRLVDVSAGCADLETLASGVFEAVAAEVPFDFACLAPVDPKTGLPNVQGFKSRPVDVSDHGFVAAEWGEPDINQLADLAKRPVPVGVLSADTGGDVMRCRRFREHMAPRYGFTDELRVMCRSRATVWAALGLYRGAGDPPFTAADGRVLAHAHKAIADAVRRTLMAGSELSGASGPAVFVLDPAGKVRELSAAAHAAVDDLGGWDMGELPAALLAAAARARASSEPISTRLRTRLGNWLTVAAVAVDGPDGAGVVITVDAAPPSAMGQLTIAARGLTAREREITGLVLQGASTKAITATTRLSPHTVQDHLKAIFTKLGVNSRREMIALLALPGTDDRVPQPVRLDEPGPAGAA